MFPYFGRKTRIAKYYPAPEYDLVIEPFAGSMGYTLHTRPPRAIGFEKDPEVVALWNRILAAEKVPTQPEIGSTTTDLFARLCCYSEHAMHSPALRVTTRMVRDWDFVWTRAIKDAQYAKMAVQYNPGSYEDAPDIEATWFIDPPYQHANRRGYIFGAKQLDFKKLAEWVMTRKGQVIVCEQEGADWLPFEPLVDLASHRGSRSSEVIWTRSGE